MMTSPSMLTKILHLHSSRGPMFHIVEEFEELYFYVKLTLIFLIVLFLIQSYAFSRPPHLPSKVLPQRPRFLVVFKPDDITASMFPQKLESENHSESSVYGKTHSIVNESDLPDFFAPLLSSSQTEIISEHLSIDLLHAAELRASILLKKGSHEIPMDGNENRPQLTLDVQAQQGCHLKIDADIGSDGFTHEQEFSMLPTSSRSKPMVKSASVTMDPALPLKNVSPALIQFPKWIEDDKVPMLRRIQGVRMIINFLAFFSTFLERSLWMIESKCKIHISRVKITPLYKGATRTKIAEAAVEKKKKMYDSNPHWGLIMRVTGHILLFDTLPIPFFFPIPLSGALLHEVLLILSLEYEKLKQKKFSEDKVILAFLKSVDTWKSSIKALVTPPSIGIDLTVAGGKSLTLETMLGKDVTAGIAHQGNKLHNQHHHIDQVRNFNQINDIQDIDSDNSYSTWSTFPESNPPHSLPRSRHQKPFKATSGLTFLQNHIVSGAANTHNQTEQAKKYDANEMVPILIDFTATGSISRDKVELNLNKASALHDDGNLKSYLSISGNVVVCRPHRVDNKRTKIFEKDDISPLSPKISTNMTAEPTSICACLLFPEKFSSNKKQMNGSNILQYDYAFEIDEDSRLDAISLAVGASQPMLKGGTVITTLLESIYVFGSIAARESAIMNPFEPRRKRNILKHLPAVDFTCAIQNIFIPDDSFSHSDDGQTMCVPEMQGGRMTIRVVGGFDDSKSNSDGEDENEEMTEEKSKRADDTSLKIGDGIKIIADFGVSSFSLNNESLVNEFPELDILEGTRLNSLISGTFSGRLTSHLRPQNLADAVPSSPWKQYCNVQNNVHNPLEAFEIDFTGTCITLKIKESNVTMGHRRVIFPSESSFTFQTVHSVLDMGFEGRSECEFCWDFQGSSPILQVTAIGDSPARASHENKQQVSILIPPLRQGRLNFHVSSVGGIRFTKAATSREYKEGLYDWKFFNALVSPDHESASRLVDILHDKRTMHRLINVVKLINFELGNIFDYALKQFWRGKEILNQEEILEPAHMIPGNKMARMLSLFLCGDNSEEKSILSIIRRVVAGEGLDVFKVKALLHDHLPAYDKWAPEIDRGVRWFAVLFSPMTAPQPYVETKVLPLSEREEYAHFLKDIPSAKIVYDTLAEKQGLPLDPNFSGLVSSIAPYMSLNQIEYVLQSRASSSDWQPTDLRRIRYVFSVKRKVLDISESYGGLSFLPQSHIVSVFVAEATRASLKARGDTFAINYQRSEKCVEKVESKEYKKPGSLMLLRRRRLSSIITRRNQKEGTENLNDNENTLLSSENKGTQFDCSTSTRPGVTNVDMTSDTNHYKDVGKQMYELGDSLLGPQDVSILLQAGLASSNSSSTVVQLNQRMLLDLIASQPNFFAVGVLCELGGHGGSPRGLASVLMSLLELNQSAFLPSHRLDIHALLSSWTGIKIPRREWYLAGGRWARQSYYDALFTVAKSILEDGEVYVALKGHIQRVRHSRESDPIPLAREFTEEFNGLDNFDHQSSSLEGINSTLFDAIKSAKCKIKYADEKGNEALIGLKETRKLISECPKCLEAIRAYNESFEACRNVHRLDKLAFQGDWFKFYYRRNYDALMVKSVYDNVINDIENVRDWLDALANSAQQSKRKEKLSAMMKSEFEGDLQRYKANDSFVNLIGELDSIFSKKDNKAKKRASSTHRVIFKNAREYYEQDIIDGIVDLLFHDEKERETIRCDPLVRLLISNPEGHYDFTVVTAMGVITDGKQGQELASAFKRIEKERGVRIIRSDTGTARSFEFNASKIEDAIELVGMGKPYGLLGYSQGCANLLMAESLLKSGPPPRQKLLQGLVCRQLLFSAANSSVHGASSNAKAQRLIVMCEEAFKYQQGYFSKASITLALNALNGLMDSPAYHKFIGGAQSLLPEGCRALWREAQHIAHVPTCIIRGVMEAHTTPESLEMISNLLTKQSGSALHDSQVHVFDAVGHPIYTINRNGMILKNCDMGGSIQSTHHWSPLDKEVDFLRTKRDIDQASFDCAKDRHIFPWVDVNARFGFIQYVDMK